MQPLGVRKCLGETQEGAAGKDPFFLRIKFEGKSLLWPIIWLRNSILIFRTFEKSYYTFQVFFDHVFCYLIGVAKIYPVVDNICQ